MTIELRRTLPKGLLDRVSDGVLHDLHARVIVSHRFRFEPLDVLDTTLQLPDGSIDVGDCIGHNFREPPFA